VDQKPSDTKAFERKAFLVSIHPALQIDLSNWKNQWAYWQKRRSNEQEKLCFLLLEKSISERRERKEEKKEAGGTCDDAEKNGVSPSLRIEESEALGDNTGLLRTRESEAGRSNCDKRQSSIANIEEIDERVSHPSPKLSREKQIQVLEEALRELRMLAAFLQLGSYHYHGT